MYCCSFYLQIIHLMVTLTQVNLLFEHVLGVYCLSSTEHTKGRKVFIKREKNASLPEEVKSKKIAKGEVEVWQVTRAGDKSVLVLQTTVFTRAQNEERTWNLEELKVQNIQNLQGKAMIVEKQKPVHEKVLKIILRELEN